MLDRTLATDQSFRNIALRTVEANLQVFLFSWDILLNPVERGDTLRTTCKRMRNFN